MRKALVSFFVGSFVVLVACGGGQGDSCDEEGKVAGECDDGLVCGKAKNDGTGDLICLKQCHTQGDCGAGEDCDGVANSSLKGCRPR
ncbi:MAG: hypothetical protein KF894_31315 [Labilithrix sp.]|nr:hypothetical protein [Labilithrix sp.]